MVRQPKTIPNQLIAEVKGIYAGLVMVEAKCCEVDAHQHQAALESDSDTRNLSDAKRYGTVVFARPLFFFQSFF